MQVSVEISLYPFSEEYIPEIVDFIERLKKYSKIEVDVNGLSTHVFGDYKAIMDALTIEIEKTFMQKNKYVFVLKILNIEYRK